jgi:hypothetical protein
MDASTVITVLRLLLIAACVILITKDVIGYIRNKNRGILHYFVTFLYLCILCLCFCGIQIM